MRIVCISDTHSRHDQLEVPPGDVLIHAGDSTMVGRVEEIVKFDHWLGRLPHPHKILIAGNHDWLFEKEPALADSLITNAVYLRDRAVTIDGVKFYGSPWQPRFMHWAFNLSRGAEIRRKWDLIPEDTDVLVTHGPPHGILDLVPRDLPGTYENTGCEELLLAVKRVRPKLHVFGHIHEGYGVVRESGTTFVNACVCDAAYRPVNPAVVVSDVV
jgi:Icc-related predicted phosphoesterase